MKLLKIVNKVSILKSFIKFILNQIIQGLITSENISELKSIKGSIQTYNNDKFEINISNFNPVDLYKYLNKL